MAGRLAAIDVGTNTVRCIVAEATGDGDFRILDDERAPVRLGEGLWATGTISAAAWARATEALTRMGKIAAGFGVVAVEAVATSAVRRATNGTAFAAAMARDAGVQLRVISGEEEAELVALSAWHHFDVANTRHALVDVGGGSAEVVLAAGEHVEEIRSLELGAVVLTERFLVGDPISPHAVAKLRKHVRKALRRGLSERGFAPQKLIGSGGGLASLGAMAMASRGERFDSIHGYEVFRSEVVHLSAMLARKTLKERRAVPGLGPDRADIIVAGVTVVDELMDYFGSNVLTINERGIREGLILRGLRTHGLLGPSSGPRDWRTAADALARSCHVDLAHAAQVSTLALGLFDAVAGPFGLDYRGRELLEAAALLHDLGYFIGYEGHHKHSYHLIRHADLVGLSPREREVVANVARYHRKALPKKKHEGFGKLAPADQELVCRLGGLLRLADGLDRRRNGAVRAMRCELTSGTVAVTVGGSRDLSVELHGAAEKADLFEAAFHCSVALAAAGGSRAPENDS